MGERSKVTRSSYRALARDAGPNLCIVHLDESFKDLSANSAVAAGKRGDFEDQDQADGIVVQQFSNADGVGADEVQLELRELVIGNLDFGEFSKACINSISGIALSNDFLYGLGRRIDCCPAMGIQLDWAKALRDIPDFGKV